MFRKHEMIPSKHMGRDVASGMAHEWENHGMVEALSDWLEQGRLKLYTVESNVSAVWTRKEVPPQERIKQHLPYERWVMDELVPFIRRDCQVNDIPIALAGTSLGAANFALKFPKVFQYALCMSGRYDATWMTDGFINEDVYFNSPISYVPGIQGEYLEQIRNHTHLSLVCGRGQWEDGNIEDTQHFASLLKEKGISHQLDLWGQDVSHQWPWWARQARHHLSGYIHAKS